MIKKKKFIILGAGPVGLITGYFLSRKGLDVSIYEMKNQVGGMCRTWKWKNFHLDTGPHIFHTSNKFMWKLWKKLFKDNLIEGTYWSKNVIGKSYDKMIDYPLSYEAVRKLDTKQKKDIKSELGYIKKNKKKNF